MKLVELKILWNVKLTVAGALWLASVSAAIAMPPDEPLAEISLSNEEVFWEPKPNLNYDSIVVTVSTPSGEVFTQNFSQGSIPFFPALEDGTYSYELYLVPPGVASAAPARPGRPEGPIDENGRPSTGNSLAPIQGRQESGRNRRGPVQSGYFTVTNGTSVDPDLEENTQ